MTLIRATKAFSGGFMEGGGGGGTGVRNPLTLVKTGSRSTGMQKNRILPPPSSVEDVKPAR